MSGLPLPFPICPSRPGRARCLALGTALLIMGGLGAQAREKTSIEAPAGESVEARLSALEAAMAQQQRPEGQTLRASWKNGLRFENADRSLTLRIGGRILWDSSWFGEDQAYKALEPSVPNGTEFRRVHLYTSGTMGRHVSFKLQLDFAGPDPRHAPFMKSVWIGLNHVAGPEKIRFGRFKEPMGLEELTSTRFGTFMERPVTSSLAPGRSNGVGAEWLAKDQRLLLEAGVFERSTNTGFAQRDGNVGFTARVAGQPLFEDGAHFVHAGASISYHNIRVDGYAFRPGLHLAPLLVAAMPADGTWIYDLEGAWVSGPFSLQGEWAAKHISGGQGLADTAIQSFYLQAGTFLTAGDHRGYKQAYAVFSRMKPHAPLAFDGDAAGWGAWEVGLRYDWIDTADGAFANTADALVNANLTTALNWYWNANIRVMFAYVHSWLDPRSGTAETGQLDAFGIRMQIDF